MHCSVHPQFHPFCPQCIVLSREPVPEPVAEPEASNGTTETAVRFDDSADISL
jgi:hypothetical protein